MLTSTSVTMKEKVGENQSDELHISSVLSREFESKILKSEKVRLLMKLRFRRFNRAFLFVMCFQC